MSARNGALGSDSGGSGVGSLGHGNGSGSFGGASHGASVHDGKLPLPDDFFRTPKLNSKETKYLINLAKRACKEVVFYSRRTGGPMNWVHLSSDDGVEVFQGVDESSVGENKSITYLRGATRIYASIDDVADFFRLDTPMKLSGFTQTVGKDLLDQKTLYDLAMPSAENPKHYVGVKWTAVESPSKLARNRDFCYLECHDEFIDTNSKKRGWVRSLHSIRLPFCPLLNKSHGLVRGSLYRSGFVFVESDDKTYVDAVHTLHMDIKGNAPNWLKIMVMKRRIKNISEVNRYFQMRRLCEGRLLSDLELPSKSGVSKCQICNHRFGLFSRKSGCRKCGKVICSPCGHHFILDYAGVGAKKVKICAHCADRVVHGDEGSEHRPMSHLGGHQLDAQPRPIYDVSPSSRGTRSQSRVTRQQSAEEREYYMNNEDDRGLADIEEAKRMNREFEEHFSQSAIAQQQQAHLPPPDVAHAKNGVANGSGGNRRVPQRGVAFEGHHNSGPFGGPEPPLARKQPKQTLSAYQEFLKNERARQKNIGAPVAASTRGASTRKSMVQTGAPAPGELLSRARQNQGQGRFSSNSTELEFTMAPPAEENPEINIGVEYEPDYEYPVSKLQRLRDNVSILSDDTVGAPIRRSDLSIGRSSRVSSSDAFHASAVDREMLPDDVIHRGQAPTLPPSYPSPTSTDSYNGSSIVYMQRPSHSVGPSSQYRNGGNSEFQEFRRSYFNARNSDIDELQERIQSAPGTDDEGDFRYGYDATSAASDATDFNEKEYEVPVSAESIARLSRRNTVAEKPPVKRDAVEDLATVMALSAMQLYEKENGLDLQVSEETRQAALKKMVEIYSNEIERNHTDEQLGSRRVTRSASVTAPNTSGAQEFAGVKKNSFYRVDRQHAQTMMSHSPYSPEYKDLSDLSASAFKAYQKGTLTDDTTSEPRSDAEPSLPSSASGTARKKPFGPESMSSSSRNVSLGKEDPSCDASTTHRGSLLNSGVHVKPSPRPNSVHDDVSDTFSELDLIDLPHLMRADEPVIAERRSVERLSQESHQTTFSEISSGRVSSSVDPTQPAPRLSELSANGTTNRASYASLHAEPGIHSPPSGTRSDSISSLSDDAYDDDGDFTSRTKMTQSELERYRASLAELMAEYNQEHDIDSFTRALQPEREHEPDTRMYLQQREATGKSPSASPQPNLEHVLQELYL